MYLISPKLENNIFENYTDWEFFAPLTSLQTLKDAIKEAIPVLDDDKEVEIIAQKFGIKRTFLDQYLAPIRDVLSSKKIPTKKKWVDLNTLNEALREYLDQNRLSKKQESDFKTQVVGAIVDIVAWGESMRKVCRSQKLHLNFLQPLVKETQKKLDPKNISVGQDFASLAAAKCCELAKKYNWSIDELKRLRGAGRPLKRKHDE